MHIAAFFLGALGLTAQVVLFREALVRTGGNELAMGALLAAWLVAGAAGALASRWPRTRGRAALYGPGLLVLLVGLAGGVLAWRHAAGLGGTLPGESQGAFLLALQALLWNGPAALAGGWLLARLAGGKAMRAPTLFGCEALGAAAAGVLLALGPVLALLPTAGALETRHGRYAVVQREEGGERWFQRNGRDAWQLSAGTPRQGRRALHALLLQVPQASRILLAADPDYLPAVLAHGPAAVDLLLTDPAVLSPLRREAGPALAAALDDPRVRVVHGGLRRCLRAGGEPFAAIWLGDLDPSDGEASRAVTVEGMQIAAAHLIPGGVLGLRLGAVDGVAGSLGMQRAAMIAAGCAATNLTPVLLADGTLFAGAPEVAWRLAADELAPVAAARALPAPLPLAAAWAELVDPGALHAWNRMLRGGDVPDDPLALLLAPDAVEPANWPAFVEGSRHTDARPRALGLSVQIAETHARGGRPGWLAALSAPPPVPAALGVFVVLLLLAETLARFGKRVPHTGEGVLSLTSSSLAGTMGLLLVLERYQEETGALYADLGWLSGAFLLGFAAGSHLQHRFRGLRGEATMLFALAVLGLWSSGTFAVAPGASVVALLLGIGVGAPVGTLAVRRGAGWAWALDLLAAAPAALFAGVVILPRAGWGGMLLGLAVLKLAVLLRCGLGRFGSAPRTGGT